MSKISSLILGLVSGAAMFGAIQYASGNDLSSTLRGTLADGDAVVAASAVPDSMVNRAGKGDRAALVASQPEASQTLSFQVHGLSDTSVLLKLAANPVPAVKVVGKAGTVSVTDKPQKRAVACEPPVSVLTEVARLIQPGRCVT